MGGGLMQIVESAEVSVSADAADKCSRSSCLFTPGRGISNSLTKFGTTFGDYWNNVGPLPAGGKPIK